MAAERDRIVRNNSVANDFRLNLPVSIQMPDGEERLSCGRPSNPRLQLPYDYDTSSEIYRSYIKPPPNKTVCCTPDWEDSKYPSSNCSRGPAVNSQSVPKSSSSGHNSVWSSLSWSRSTKSPPSSSHTRHRTQQHQRHSHPSNPSGSRHSSSSSSLSSCSSSGSKHKSFLGPLAVCSSLMEASHSIGSSTDKQQQRLQPVSREISSTSIAERLFGTLSTEKIVLQSQSTSEKTLGVGANARTSPSNNNLSPSSSGVLSRIFDDPFSSSSSSSKIRKGKKSGRVSLEPSQGEDCLTAALSHPSPTRVLASVVVKETSGEIAGEMCRAVDQYTAYHYPSSSSWDPSVLISSKSECPGGGTISNPDSSTESREEDGCGWERNCQNNDNNGNSRTRVLSTDIGRHCDTSRLGEGGSGRDRIIEEKHEGGGGNNCSKNLHSTTDSSLYHHHRMHPGLIGSALLSESEKETAHQSELSDNSTAIQLSEQYCSTAEIASTSSSSGQTKDVRSPRDVT